MNKRKQEDEVVLVVLVLVIMVQFLVRVYKCELDFNIIIGSDCQITNIKYTEKRG